VLTVKMWAEYAVYPRDRVVSLEWLDRFAK
jgi:hypothetical protein